MSLFSSIKDKIKDSMNSSSLDKQAMQELRKDADRQAKIEFERKYKEDYKKLAVEKAIMEASQKVGYARFKAEQRAMNMGKDNAVPGTFLSKLKDYTTKNLAKTTENRERNERLKKALAEERSMKLNQMKSRRPMGKMY